MSDEAAFLAALKANPADDTARLVYADWLDERDEPAKAEYLRYVAAFAQREGNLAIAHEASQFLERAAQLAPEWRTGAGARFALILDRYTEKVYAIKWIREVTGDGLGEAKEASEHLPHTVFACVPYEIATVARSRVDPNRVDTRIAPSDADPLPAGATYDIVVRCDMNTTRARSRDAVRARQEAERTALAALATLFATARGVSEAEAEQLVVLQQDILLATGLTLQEARTRRVSLSHLVLPYDPNRGWSMWIHRRLRPAPTNSE